MAPRASPAASRMPAYSARRSYSPGFRAMTSAMSAAARLKSRSRAAFCAAFSLISSSCDNVPMIFRFLGGASFLSLSPGVSTTFGGMVSFSGSWTRRLPGRRPSSTREAGTTLPGGGGIGGSRGPSTGGLALEVTGAAAGGTAGGKGTTFGSSVTIALKLAAPPGAGLNGIVSGCASANFVGPRRSSPLIGITARSLPSTSSTGPVRVFVTGLTSDDGTNGSAVTVLAGGVGGVGGGAGFTGGGVGLRAGGATVGAALNGSSDTGLGVRLIFWALLSDVSVGFQLTVAGSGGAACRREPSPIRSCPFAARKEPIRVTVTPAHEYHLCAARTRTGRSGAVVCGAVEFCMQPFTAMSSSSAWARAPPPGLPGDFGPSGRNCPRGPAATPDDRRAGCPRHDRATSDSPHLRHSFPAGLTKTPGPPNPMEAQPRTTDASGRGGQAAGSLQCGRRTFRLDSRDRNRLSPAPSGPTHEPHATQTADQRRTRARLHRPGAHRVGGGGQARAELLHSGGHCRRPTARIAVPGGDRPVRPRTVRSGERRAELGAGAHRSAAQRVLSTRLLRARRR